MQERAAANVAFLRRIAEQQAVYAGEEGGAIGGSTVRRAELPGMHARQLDALRRIRMAGEEVQVGIGGAADAAEIRVVGHRLKEPGSRIGIVAGKLAGLDADRVGFKLLIARELREPQLALDQRHPRGRRLAEHIGDHLAGQNLLGFLLLPLQSVIGGHMAHLVGDHRGQFGRIVGERQQSARHVEIAARQSEGVYVRRIEDGDPIGLGRDCSTRSSGCRPPWQPYAPAWDRSIRRHRSPECADAEPAPVPPSCRCG